VPQDVAIVGVDNIEFICEGTSPTLSSISRNWQGEGSAAAELLEEWMLDPGRRPPSRAVSALHVVRRASTFFAADRRVARAMEFIRLHACDEDFGPRDVVREMGCSRTLADTLFRKVGGHSILDEIHGVRLARAKELLLLGKSADFVAAACGYASYDDFCRVFKRRVGSTVRKWTLGQKRPV
jgi:LacI family transcriptional regulator